MLDVEGKWPNKVEQAGSTLGLSKIRTADTPPVHDTSIQKLIINYSHWRTKYFGTNEKMELWHILPVFIWHQYSMLDLN